jgi:tetratricopeptide (TPR) repeat protein
MEMLDALITTAKALFRRIGGEPERATVPNAPAQDRDPRKLVTAERSVATGAAPGAVIVTGDKNVISLPTTDGGTGSRRFQLPADIEDFQGREREIEQLLDVLGDSGQAAITAIGGMGGVGKSALAVHVAHRLVEHYPDGQLVVDMGGTSDAPLTPVEAMGKVIHSFDPAVRLPEAPDDVAALYRSTLAGKHALVVLDNAADAAQVRPLTPPPPSGVIITSRRAIVLPGLRSFLLGALSEAEARALLRAILGPDRASAAERDEIARRCGRLPLALRVAGTFLAGHLDWTVGEYLEALADERQRLQRLRVNDDPELDVAASLSLSATQLAREQPELVERWRMLAVFPADFDRAAVAAVCEVSPDQARDELSALVGRSMVLFDQDSGRHRLHDLMRDVARGTYLAEDEAASEQRRQRSARAAARHAAHYLTVLGTARNLYMQRGERITAGLELFDLERRNIEAGQAWAAQHAPESHEAARLCSEYPDAGVYVLNLRQHPRECIAWLEAAVEAAGRLNDRAAEGRHLGNLDTAYGDLGETRRAIGYHEQDLKIARKIGDRRGEGGALSNLGNAYADLGGTRRAIRNHKQALEIMHKIGNRQDEGAVLGSLGNAYADLGKPRRAIEYYEQQLEITCAIGDRRGEGNALGSLGRVYALLGETRCAIGYYEQQWEIGREIGDRRGEGTALCNSALAFHELGDRALAIERMQAALAIFEAIEDPNADRVRATLAEWCGEGG